MEIVIKNSRAETERIHEALERFATDHALPPAPLLALDLALEELVTNIISYAFPDREEHKIRVAFQINGTELRVSLEDDGQPFNPVLHPQPDVSLAIDDKPIGGLGIHMARKSVDRMEYSRNNNHNRLLLVKNLGTRA